MSPTNIHKAAQLLNHVGSTFDSQVTIMPSGRRAYTVYVAEFSQETVDKYTKLINRGIEGQWLSWGNDPTRVFRVVEPSLPFDIPKVCISWVLKQLAGSTYDEEIDTSQQTEEPLYCLLVVQGKNARERSKVVVARSLEDATTSILHEAINGYSVVFMGALLRSDMNELFSDAKSCIFSLKKLPDVAALNAFSGSKEAQTFQQIGIIC
ncbi:MAG: hypothetical protein Q9172_007205 [Xanthocarpia lactea]